MIINQISEILGMDQNEAAKQLLVHGYYISVASADGNYFPLPMVFDPERVIVNLKDGKIISYTVG